MQLPNFSGDAEVRYSFMKDVDGTEHQDLIQKPAKPMFEVPNVFIAIVVILLGTQLFMTSIIALRVLNVSHILERIEANE